MQEEMAKLNVVAKGGSLDAIKAAVGETGKSCKALPRQLPQGMT